MGVVEKGRRIETSKGFANLGFLSTPGFTDYAKRKMIVGNEILFLREEA